MCVWGHMTSLYLEFYSRVSAGLFYLSPDRAGTSLVSAHHDVHPKTEAAAPDSPVWASTSVWEPSLPCELVCDLCIPATLRSWEMQSAGCHLKGEQTQGTSRLLEFLPELCFPQSFSSFSPWKSGPIPGALLSLMNTFVSSPAVLEGTLFYSKRRLMFASATCKRLTSSALPNAEVSLLSAFLLISSFDPDLCGTKDQCYPCVSANRSCLCIMWLILIINHVSSASPTCPFPHYRSHFLPLTCFGMNFFFLLKRLNTSNSIYLD